MELDLKEAVRHRTRIEIPTRGECAPDLRLGLADGKVETGATCHGRGQVRMQRGIVRDARATCPTCGNGSETVIANRARQCDGAGRVKGQTLSVKIPAGVEGDRIRLAGRGEGRPASTQAIST